MAKLIVAVVVGLGLASPAWAQRKDCGELKMEIEAKIKKNGVEKLRSTSSRRTPRPTARWSAPATGRPRRSSTNAASRPSGRLL
jgi:hypothetical protein